MEITKLKETLSAWHSITTPKIANSVREDLFEVFKNNLDRNSMLEFVKEPTRSILLKEKWYDVGSKYLDNLAKRKIKFVYFGGENYPKNLYKLPSPPLFLSFVGTACWNNGYKLSVVGSRNPGDISLKWMEDNLTSLFEGGICSVSGAAMGIDQKTHIISTRVCKPTVAFLPSGLANIYPNSFNRMVGGILESGGAVVSEYPFDGKMLKHNFHHRNRLIAALGDAVLVVEARMRSGTMITANKAIELGVPLGVIPAHPTDAKFCGNVKLLADGITPIRDAKDLLVSLSQSHHLVSQFQP